LIGIEKPPDAIYLHNKIGDINKWLIAKRRNVLLNVRAEISNLNVLLYVREILLLYLVHQALLKHV
jgi:hypothetical protein